MKNLKLGQTWKKHLDLSNRKAPELYENADDARNTPHAGAIRTTFQELNASAVFCVQNVPTVVILSVEDYDHRTIMGLHAALWNQGLASLLLVISDDSMRAFSLSRIPRTVEDPDFDNTYLVQELNTINNALEIKNIIYGVESGRFWEEHTDYFISKERIDQVLLTNLSVSHQLLCDTELSSDAAQAILIQTMFVAYLEDRKIINCDYFMRASDGTSNSFLTLLESRKVNSLLRLFEILQENFSGNLFVAPHSFEEKISSLDIKEHHLNILARFRSGQEVMNSYGGQYQFWGYDFKYIPIELISAVYDRFLSEKKAEQRKQGSYYTPAFLADTVISQVWDSLSVETKNKGHFLDPACGSGIFLVRSFQRLCEHWREMQESQTIDWNSLLSILSRLHGWDSNSTAVRVSMFSLYIALLEQVTPPDIQLLIKQGKLLPDMWGQNLRHQDFFTVAPNEVIANVIIGNPPWSSRKGTDRPSVKWCKTENLPIPSNEDAWGFVWKSLRHLPEDGIAAFLLPAMGFLHNHARNTVSARNRFIHNARIIRIVNFADLRFQLFEGAVRPAALIVFGTPTQKTPVYQFDYWVPKADLNLKTKRMVTICRADKSRISSHMATENPLIFKQLLWMNDPEKKLFNYISAFPRLNNLASMYGTATREKKDPDEGQWLIGQGFQPFNAEKYTNQTVRRLTSNYIGKLPYLPVENLQPLAQALRDLPPWPSNYVRRKGFEKGFINPRILIKQGINTRQKRLRAAYIETPMTFQDSIQALVVPRGNKRRAKLLTALLNSKLTTWFVFHGTGSFGSDRPIVHQSELLSLPFPTSNDMPDRKRSKSAENELVLLIDQMMKSVNRPSSSQRINQDTFEKLDNLTYQFFCLSKEEITLIEDTVERIIPAVQPKQTHYPDIWKPADSHERKVYADTLVDSLTEWFDCNSTIGIKLKTCNNDLAILCLTLEEKQGGKEYTEESNLSFGKVLDNLFKHIHHPLPGNFQLMPDFRIFIGNNLYLVKPTQKRFWLKSNAIADADSIALDLQNTTGFLNNWSHRL